MRLLSGLLMMLVSFATAREALTQRSVMPSISMSGGSATDISGHTSGAVTIAPSLWISPSPRVLLGLSGSATHYRGDHWSVTGGASVSARHVVGAAALTVDGGAVYSASSYDLSSLVGDVTPAAEISAGPLTVFGGAHVTHATNWAVSRDAGAATPGLLPGRLGEQFSHRESATAVAVRATYGAAARMNFARGMPATFTYREERGAVAGHPQVDRSIAARISRGMFGVHGSALIRNVAGEESRSGIAGVSLALTQSLSAQVSSGSYPENVLTGASAGRFVNAGVSVRLGRGEYSLPKPAGVPAVRAGMTRISIAANDAKRVELAGDFTNWEFRTAQRATNGVWYLDLELPPGQYRYAFRVDGAKWRIPDGAPAAEDDFGGKSAWLRVGRG